MVADAVGRLPPGRRGLKHYTLIAPIIGALSPSPRKAWIETARSRSRIPSVTSPSPRKAWIETSRGERVQDDVACRLPPGRRGLKQSRGERVQDDVASPSPRKAWIETAS